MVAVVATLFLFCLGIRYIALTWTAHGPKFLGSSTPHCKGAGVETHTILDLPEGIASARIYQIALESTRLPSSLAFDVWPQARLK